MLASRRDQQDIVRVGQHLLIRGNIGNAAGHKNIHFIKAVAVQLFREAAGLVPGAAVGKQQMPAHINILPTRKVLELFQAGLLRVIGKIKPGDVILLIMFHLGSSI